MNRIEKISRRERDDGYYRIVALLNPGWRVVECRNGIQWILQRLGSPKRSRRGDWRGLSYCRTREALIRSARQHFSDIDPAAGAILAALPEWIGQVKALR
ncbi:MAG TPA: hypothetical protein VNY08_09890 [Bradyrhizobium sp.]|jgi:hypothetical protein|nr:hypothetical protein [Bradyrhizobium sp.]